MKAENERVAKETRRQIETKLEEAADNFVEKLERLNKCESKLTEVSAQVIDDFITTLARLNECESNLKEDLSKLEPYLTPSEDGKAGSLLSPVTTQFDRNPHTAEIPSRELKPPDKEQTERMLCALCKGTHKRGKCPSAGKVTSAVVSCHVCKAYTRKNNVQPTGSMHFFTNAGYIERESCPHISKLEQSERAAFLCA